MAVDGIRAGSTVIRVVPSRRGRIPLGLLTTLATSCALVAFAIRFSAWGPVAAVFLVTWSGTVQRRWWAAQTPPGQLRGTLVRPRSRFWHEHRCTVSSTAEHLVVHRFRSRDAWVIPWTEIDDLAVEDGRHATFTASQEDDVLVEISTVLSSRKVIALLS